MIFHLIYLPHFSKIQSSIHVLLGWLLFLAMWIILLQPGRYKEVFHKQIFFPFVELPEVGWLRYVVYFPSFYWFCGYTVSPTPVFKECPFSVIILAHLPKIGWVEMWALIWFMFCFAQPYFYFCSTTRMFWSWLSNSVSWNFYC